MQIDGYKVLTTKKWKNRFKRSKFKRILSPGNCTDLNTSVVDAHIGKQLKDYVRHEIQKMRETDPVTNNKIETSGISCLRVQITYWAAAAWKQLCASGAIEKAFKKCGLCNDINGLENEKVEVLDLLTWSVPPKTFIPRKEPYSEEEQWALYQNEFDAFQNERKRKHESDESSGKSKRRKLSFI